MIACQGQHGVAGTPPNTIPTWETVFTAMFMHASILHIGGNMLFLWIFGNNVEDAMGPVEVPALLPPGRVRGVCTADRRVAELDRAHSGRLRRDRRRARAATSCSIPAPAY